MTKSFKAIVGILLLTILVLLIQIGKQSPEALANRAPQQQLDRARLAAAMINTVTSRAGRMYDLCSYVATAAVQVRMESLVPRSKCEGIRTAQNDAIANINRITRTGSDEDLKVMSRAVDQFMIDTAPQLRTMEESYATVSRIMREAGMK